MLLSSHHLTIQQGGTNMRTMRTTDSKIIAFALIIACALVLSSGVPASADENYACRCKGIKQWFLFIPSYRDCGNGFAGGSKGQVTRDISRNNLSSYIPPGVSGPVTTGGSQCGYYPDSGWNCGKMSGRELPQCLND